MIRANVIQQYTGDKTRISVDLLFIEAAYFDIQHIWLWHRWKIKDV